MNSHLLESGTLYSTLDDSPVGVSISPISVRQAFVKKVYSLLSLQLLLTAAVASPFVIGNPIRVQTFIAENIYLFWLSLAVSVGVMITFACAPQLMRRYPTNYALMFLFTLAEGLSVGILSSMFTTASIVVAFGLVAVVTITLSAIATNSKVDFTKSLWPYLTVATVVMIASGLLLMLFPTNVGTTIYAALGALLFSAYLVFDTQMIVGGKSEMQYSIDDYVPAAIALYIDIVSLFIYFLQLFGDRRE